MLLPGPSSHSVGWALSVGHANQQHMDVVAKQRVLGRFVTFAASLHEDSGDTITATATPSIRHDRVAAHPRDTKAKPQQRRTKRAAARDCSTRRQHPATLPFRAIHHSANDKDLPRWMLDRPCLGNSAPLAAPDFINGGARAPQRRRAALAGVKLAAFGGVGPRDLAFVSSAVYGGS